MRSRALPLPSAPAATSSTVPPRAPRASAAVTTAVDGEKDEEVLPPQPPPHASTALPLSAAAASRASPLSAAELAAAALASRRSDPTIRGRIMVKRSPAAPKVAVQSPLPAAPAPFVGALPGQLPAPLEQVSTCSSSQTELPDDDPPPPKQSSAVVELVPETPPPEQLVHVPSSETFPAVVDAREDAPWVFVQPRRSMRRMAYGPPASKTRPPPPAWLNGRCHRCHEAGHWASICCERLRCNNCREFGHKAKRCTGRTAPRPPPVQVRHAVQMPAVVHRRPWQRSSPRPQLQPESPPRPSGVQLQFASQPVDPRSPLRCPTAPSPPATSVVQATLAEQAMLLHSELHDCLARVESFLVRAGAALGTSPTAPDASPPTELSVASVDIGEDGLYGPFSPRAMPSPPPQPHVQANSEGELLTPVMLIMPELQKLCAEPATPLSMAHVEMATFGPSAMDPMPPSLEPSRSLVVVDSEALFAKELGNLLVSLEKASPGSSREINCLLSGKNSGDKIKKVKEYLRSLSRKSGAARKASAAA